MALAIGWRLTMHFSLRARFLVATFALVLVPLTGFVYAVSQFVEIFEQQILTGEAGREMEMFAQAYAANPQMSAPRIKGLRGYIATPGNLSELPPTLAKLNPGIHREIKIDGIEYDAVRRDVAGTRLYLVLDIAAIENFEDQATRIAWACGVTALCFAALLAFWLSYLVLKPVKSLAQRVSSITPGQPRPALAPVSADREITIITDSFSQVLDRFDAFMAREQAFTEDASHELRTPLAIVASSAELLSGDAGLSQKSRERLQRLQMAVAQMHKLIEALLFLAREDGGGVHPLCNMSEVLQNAVNVYNEGIAAPQQPAVLHIQGDRQVQVSEGMLLLVINNLLRNAKDHGGDGPTQVVLNHECLVVQDAGIGIAPATVARMFDRYARGGDSSGMGLGLFIVKRICERLGWHIAVNSVPGAGTRFELRFAEPTKN